MLRKLWSLENIYSILSIKLLSDITKSNKEGSLAPLALVGNVTCCVRKFLCTVCRKLLLATVWPFHLFQFMSAKLKSPTINLNFALLELISFINSSICHYFRRSWMDFCKCMISICCHFYCVILHTHTHWQHLFSFNVFHGIYNYTTIPL